MALSETQIIKSPLYMLSPEELLKVQEQLNAGKVICGHCKQWKNQVRLVPHRYQKYLGRSWWADAIDQLYSPSLTHACAYCIADAADKKRKKDEQSFEIRQGHLDSKVSMHAELFEIFGCSYRSKREKTRNPGYVYVVWHDDYVKIGATAHSVRSRMSSYGYKKADFICAIDTEYPFLLESVLHRQYSKQAVKVEGRSEIFNLTQNDIDYIRNLKTLDGNPIYVIPSINDVP